MQNGEHEQASKRAKEEQVGRDMYRFSFFSVTGFFGGGILGVGLRGSEDAGVGEGVVQDGVFDGGEDEADVGRVGRLGEAGWS